MFLLLYIPLYVFAIHISYRYCKNSPLPIGVAPNISSLNDQTLLAIFDCSSPLCTASPLKMTYSAVLKEEDECGLDLNSHSQSLCSSIYIPLVSTLYTESLPPLLIYDTDTLYKTPRGILNRTHYVNRACIP